MRSGFQFEWEVSGLKSCLLLQVFRFLLFETMAPTELDNGATISDLEMPPTIVDAVFATALDARSVASGVEDGGRTWADASSAVETPRATEDVTYSHGPRRPASTSSSVVLGQVQVVHDCHSPPRAGKENTPSNAASPLTPSHQASHKVGLRLMLNRGGEHLIGKPKGSLWAHFEQMLEEHMEENDILQKVRITHLRLPHLKSKSVFIVFSRVEAGEGRCLLHLFGTLGKVRFLDRDELDEESTKDATFKTKKSRQNSAATDGGFEVGKLALALIADDDNKNRKSEGLNQVLSMINSCQKRCAEVHAKDEKKKSRND